MRGSLQLNAQDNTGFPKGFDAVEVAPQSHKVLYENALVRVLQVQLRRGVCVSQPPGSELSHSSSIPGAN
jgi:hypothetical protein